MTPGKTEADALKHAVKKPETAESVKPAADESQKTRETVSPGKTLPEKNVKEKLEYKNMPQRTPYRNAPARARRSN